jgi:hypothetical protein
MVYLALLPLMRTPRLPVVDWTDAPAVLNGLSVSPKDEIWFLRVCHHISNGLYTLRGLAVIRLYESPHSRHTPTALVATRLWVAKTVGTHWECSFPLGSRSRQRVCTQWEGSLPLGSMSRHTVETHWEDWLPLGSKGSHTIDTHLEGRLPRGSMSHHTVCRY